MNLHQDILTDLVILYHAGEASQATRALLEEEALTNSKLAAALKAPPRYQPALPEPPDDTQRIAIQHLRRYVYLRLIFVIAGMTCTLLVLALRYTGVSNQGDWVRLFEYVAIGSWVVAVVMGLKARSVF